MDVVSIFLLVFHDYMSRYIVDEQSYEADVFRTVVIETDIEFAAGRNRIRIDGIVVDNRREVLDYRKVKRRGRRVINQVPGPEG